MSHVIVGERLAGAAPQIAGHLVVGAGHFIEMANGLFQPGAMHMPPIPVIAQSKMPDLSTPVAAERWQWEHLNRTFGSGSFVAHNSNGIPSYLDGINFSMTAEPVNFSKGINFSMEKKTTLAFGLDMHYDGPGSESESLRESYRDQVNREAADRIENGSKDPRDAERANDYYRDHSA